MLVVTQEWLDLHKKLLIKLEPMLNALKSEMVVKLQFLKNSKLKLKMHVIKLKLTHISKVNLMLWVSHKEVLLLDISFNFVILKKLQTIFLQLAHQAWEQKLFQTAFLEFSVISLIE